MRPKGSHLETGFQDFLDKMKELVPSASVIVEIGSYRGESSVMIAKAFPEATVFCVDSWSGGYEKEDLNTRPEVMPEVEKDFDKNVSGLENIVKVKSDSIQAASNFPVGMKIDLLYIDADHSYEGVKADIAAWVDKVKTSGVISGHDYDQGHRGVVEAVNELLGTPHFTFNDSTWAFKS